MSRLALSILAAIGVLIIPFGISTGEVPSFQDIPIYARLIGVPILTFLFYKFGFND